jgi:hypothetical protein
MGEEKSALQIKNERRHQNEEKLNRLKETMTEEQKRTNDANRETGALNWVSSLPSKIRPN